MLMTIVQASDDGLTFPGDPTLLGWLTVVCYAIAAGLCLNAARAAQHRVDRAHWSRRAFFWNCLAALLIALGINKQLDLQVLLVIAGKRLSKAQGWYEQRRIVQIACALIVALAVSFFMLVIAWLTRRAWRQYGLALVGLSLLAGFVIVRVAYFERMDDLVGIPLRASRAKWVLEIGGVVCIGLSAWRHGRQARTPTD